MIRRTTKRNVNKGSKKNKVPRVGRLITNDNKVHKFTRIADKGTVALSAAATVAGGLNFQLSDVPNSTEFTALFDQYMIEQIDLTMFMGATQVGVGGSGFTPPLLGCVIDFDSDTAPASLNDIREFKTYRRVMYGSAAEMQWSFRPNYRGVAEDATTSVVEATINRGYLRTTRNNIPHYGFRYFFEQLAAGFTGNVQFEAKYHLAFKHLK